MNFADERYVRLYTRDTKTWILLGWEGQIAFCLLERKVDRAGVLDDVFTGEDLVVVLRNGLPVDVAERGLERLIKLHVVEVGPRGLVIPRFIEAQETPQSDRKRSAESRARRRDLSRNVTDETQSVSEESRNVSQPSQSVTPRHEPSQPVTPYRAVPCRTVPNQPEGSDALPRRPTVAKSASKAELLAENWEPNPKHVQALAARFGVPESRITQQVQDFRWYWREGSGSGKRRTNNGWERAFGNRIEMLAKSEALFAEARSGHNGSKTTTLRDVGW